MPTFRSSLARRPCAPAAPPTRRLTVATLEDRVTPVGELLHTLTPPSSGSLYDSAVAASAQYVVGGAPGTTLVPGAAGIYDATSRARLWSLTNPSASNG